MSDFDWYEIDDPIDCPSWMTPEADAGINDQQTNEKATLVSQTQVA